jgi:hypothetical protein
LGWPAQLQLYSLEHRRTIFIATIPDANADTHTNPHTIAITKRDANSDTCAGYSGIIWRDKSRTAVLD